MNAHPRRSEGGAAVGEKDPIAWAELWLKERKASNEAAGIWPSECKVIGRMLRPTYRVDLHRFYRDLAKKQPDLIDRARALDGLLGVMSLYRPDRIREAKEAAERLDAINREMAELCERMASLHETRHRLTNRHDMTCPDDAHPLDWIEHGLAASDPTTRHLHEWWVAPELERAGTFDLKYWPTPEAMFSGLADLYAGHESEVIDETMAAAFTGYTATPRALMRALWERQSRDRPGTVPPYRLTDASMATLVCVTADDSDATSANTVKRARRELIDHLHDLIETDLDEPHLERQMVAILKG